MITATLQRAWADISGFLVVMAIMFLAYSLAVSSFPQLTSTCCSICPSGVPANRDHLYTFQSNLMYGWKLFSYRTLLDAAQTMISLQLGIFNYEEVSFWLIMIVPEQKITVFLFAYFFCVIFQVLDYSPVLGAFLIGSCIVFMTFVVLNLFISVVLVAFSQEQIRHKVTSPCWHFIKNKKHIFLNLDPLSKSLCLYSHQKRRKLWTWCWWNLPVYLVLNVRNKVEMAERRRQPFLIMVQLFLLETVKVFLTEYFDGVIVCSYSLLDLNHPLKSFLTQHWTINECAFVHV